MAQSLTDPLPSPWSRLWQIPLLLAGLALFAYGAWSLRATKKHIPFAEYAQDIQHLIDRKDYVGALKQIALVSDAFPQQRPQAQLEVLSGDALYLAQQQQSTPVVSDYTKVIKHYRTALALGAASTPVMEERWGQAALALRDYPVAISHLEPFTTDPRHLRDVARPLVEAYLALEPPDESKAVALLEKFAASPEVDDRVWALTRRIQLTLGTPALAKAVELADAAAPDIRENAPAGTLQTWLGRAEYEQGHLDQARTHLQEALKQFKVVGHTLDEGRAALLLGRIAQSKKEYDSAAEFYQEIITSHAGSPLMAAAYLGRAEIHALQSNPDAQMRADYALAIKAVLPGEAAKTPPEMITVDAVRASLLAQHEAYQHADKPAEALVFLELAGLLKETETANLAYREAVTQQKRAEELAGEAQATPADQAARRAELYDEALRHFQAAAQAYLRHAHLVTLNDALSADSTWAAAALFDKAGQTERAIEVYSQFVAQRPRDSRVPEGLHTIGLLYQSLGKFDQAIPYFRRNMKENPKTPASYLSMVQLARCYMAQGEGEFPKAEAVLLIVVERNGDIEPTAKEFRTSLFALGELYYRTRRWSDAILRIEEAITRYPEDPLVPRATFWLADAYRKSAGEIADAIKKDPAIDQRDRLEQARQDRLHRAGTLFGQVIAHLDPDPDAASSPPSTPRPLAQRDPLTPLDHDYLRYSYLYRADCLYDLGEYQAAIKLYDQAATRFANQIAAVEAYIQVVNAYLALKEPAQASAAAERARWVLKRVPDDAFSKGPLGLTRQYYEDFLKLGRIGT